MLSRDPDIHPKPSLFSSCCEWPSRSTPTVCSLHLRPITTPYNKFLSSNTKLQDDQKPVFLLLPLCDLFFSLLAHWNSPNTPEHSSHHAQWCVSCDASRWTQEPEASERPVMQRREPSAFGRQFSTEGAKKFEPTAKEWRSGSKGKDEAWPCSCLTEKRSGSNRHIVLRRPVTCWGKLPNSLF